MSDFTYLTVGFNFVEKLMQLPEGVKIVSAKESPYQESAVFRIYDPQGVLQSQGDFEFDIDGEGRIVKKPYTNKGTTRGGDE